MFFNWIWKSCGTVSTHDVTDDEYLVIIALGLHVIISSGIARFPTGFLDLSFHEWRRTISHHKGRRPGLAFDKGGLTIVPTVPWHGALRRQPPGLDAFWHQRWRTASRAIRLLWTYATCFAELIVHDDKMYWTRHLQFMMTCSNISKLYGARPPRDLTRGLPPTCLIQPWAYDWFVRYARSSRVPDIHRDHGTCDACSNRPHLCHRCKNVQIKKR